MQCGVCCGDGCNKEEVIKAQINSRDYNQEHDPQLINPAQLVQATIAEEPFIQEEEPPEEKAIVEPPRPEEKQDLQPLPEPAPQAKASDQDNYFFEVKIVKTPSSGLGVDLSPHDGKSLLVGKVKEGAFRDWNASRPADACDLVTCGDRIVAVNGKEGSAEDILGQMRADSVLNMTIRRRLVVNVRVRRTPGDELGVNLVEMTGGCIIESITPDGAADKANRKHGSELDLRPGDYVLQAGGCTESEKIKEQMRSGKDIEFKLRRANERPYTGSAG